MTNEERDALIAQGWTQPVAKPGMAWKVHDGSNHCPVDPDSYVWIKRHAPLFSQTAILMAGAVGWPNVTHYAIITPPAEDVA